MTQMPAAAGYIGDFDAEPATVVTLQTNVFIAASVTVADFVDLPVWPIGTMPVQRAANSQIPTLQALTAGQDGAGLWNEQTNWTFPLGQNGAAASSYQPNANPNTCSASLNYALNHDGMVHVSGVIAWGGAGGATSAALTFPLSQKVTDQIVTVWDGGVGVLSSTHNSTQTTAQFLAVDGLAYRFTNALTGQTWSTNFSYKAF